MITPKIWIFVCYNLRLSIQIGPLDISYQQSEEMKLELCNVLELEMDTQEQNYQMVEIKNDQEHLDHVEGDLSQSQKGTK